MKYNKFGIVFVNCTSKPNIKQQSHERMCGSDSDLQRN